MDKVKLPKEVSNQVEALRRCSYSNWSILNFIEKNGVQGAVFKNWISEETEEPNERFDIFLQALVNGYEVEETPEEQIKAHFLKHWENQKTLSVDRETSRVICTTISNVLNALNIKIVGVNHE